MISTSKPDEKYFGIAETTFKECFRNHAKYEGELEWLLRIVKGLSDDIGMEFGLSKCVKATFKKGKLEKSDHVRLDEETVIKDLEQEKVYKYLGVDESSGIQHATMKQKLKKELVGRT